MEKIAVASQKGGPGKTTTTVNLAAGLALAGFRVLVADIEPQAQAGVALGVRLKGGDIAKSLALPLQQLAQGVPSTLRSIIIDRSDLLQARKAKGTLHLLASEQATMTNAQHILHAAGVEKVHVLRELLQEFEDEYDFAVFDTPPAVQSLNGVALAASDYALTLCMPKGATVEGAVTMRSTIRHVKDRTRGLADPKYLGAVLNMAKPMGDWSTEEINVRNQMVDANLLPFVTEIREDSRISGSYSKGLPAVLGFARAAPGKRYAQFLQEVLDRMDAPEEGWEIAQSADEMLDAAEAASVPAQQTKEASSV
ncbi:ParA family protein [Streptomyces sp. WZ-12]|uniref:ParA family protein n=1 Tax=Streptomyces sp. WZ-12 TaxID=3030210 RepID=UPI0023814B01|nr:ParA family protein [Streptomyces sp. WZ-12]